MEIARIWCLSSVISALGAGPALRARRRPCLQALPINDWGIETQQRLNQNSHHTASKGLSRSSSAVSEIPQESPASLLPLAATVAQQPRSTGAGEPRPRARAGSTLCLKNQPLALQNVKRLKIYVNLERGRKRNRLHLVLPPLPSWLAISLRLCTSRVIDHYKQQFCWSDMSWILEVLYV